ncbi:MAG: M12 family metallopeptidase [Acidobacteriota bacterium]
MKDTVLVCTPKSLPKEKAMEAARTAIKINPQNHVPIAHLAGIMPGLKITPQRIALVTKKYWGLKGVQLTVSFMDTPATDLRKRILQHMNAWAETANVKFTETKKDGQVRIARVGGADGGYWSYLGTDVLLIAKNKQTMNLEGFTMQTEESEYHRVIRHETGHTLGFPHEHMRKVLVDRIDPAKAIAFFMRTQGWSEEEVRAQVLTPIEESTIQGTTPDQRSIMCYQIPGSLTKDGKPIIGGKDIDKSDATFAAGVYPKTSKPKSPKKKAKAKASGA